MNKKGFTLIELLVVIIILSIILIIAVPKINDAINNSKKNTFLSSIKLLGSNLYEDSTLTNSTEYKLSTLGVLTNTKLNQEIIYKGKIYAKEEVTLKTGENGKLELVGGIISDATKKYCIAFEGENINIKSLTINDIVKCDVAEAIELFVTKNITKPETTGSVTFKYFTNGKLVLYGTGDGIMNDAENYDSIIYMIWEELAMEIFGLDNLDEENPKYSDYLLVAGFYYSCENRNFEEALDEYVAKYEGDYTSTRQEIISSLKNGFSLQTEEEAIAQYNLIDIDCNPISEIIISDGVKHIGSWAFNSYQASKLTLGSDLETIGESAFYDNKFTSIIIPSGVTAIGNNAFGNNFESYITQITIKGDENRFNNRWTEIGFPLNLRP